LVAKATTEEAAHLIRMETLARKAKEELESVSNAFAVQISRVNNTIKEEEARLVADKAKQLGLDEVAKAKLAREVATTEANLDKLRKESQIDVDAFVARMKATPEEVSNAWGGNSPPHLF
jgi:molecular chaperone DnaK (HSP70)